MEYTTQLRSAAGEVPDEVFLPQLSDFTGEVDVDWFIAFDVMKGGWAKKLWPQIICTAYPELEGKSFKELLLMLVLKTVHNRFSGRANLDWLASGGTTLTVWISTMRAPRPDHGRYARNLKCAGCLVFPSTTWD